MIGKRARSCLKIVANIFNQLSLTRREQFIKFFSEKKGCKQRLQPSVKLLFGGKLRETAKNMHASDQLTILTGGKGQKVFKAENLSFPVMERFNFLHGFQMTRSRKSDLIPGERLKSYSQHWKEFQASRGIRKLVQFGYKMKFDSMPKLTQQRAAYATSLPEEQMKLVRASVSEFVAVSIKTAMFASI